MAEKTASEMWKKAFLIGLGATAMTVERIQELANELVERGEMTQGEAKNFGEDLKNRAMKEKEQFESKVKETVESTMKTAAKNMGFVTREEFDELKTQLDAMKESGSKKSTKAKSEE